MGLTVEAASAVLKNIAMVAVVGVTVPPMNTGSHPTSTNPDVSNSNKEYAQSALETLLRSHSISRLVDACRVYGASLGDRCVGNVVSVFSELVLNSSKFFAQVRFSTNMFLFFLLFGQIIFGLMFFISLLCFWMLLMISFHRSNYMLFAILTQYVLPFSPFLFLL